MRLWQRALNRAEIPLAYSEGFSPHPKISLAAPLAVGITSEAELMDIVIAKWLSPHSFTATVSPQLPSGIEILQVFQIPLNLPSLQSQIRHAEYRVELAAEKGKKDIESDINSLLSMKKLPWEHQRDTGTRYYDLRGLIDSLHLVDWCDKYCTVEMRLRCDNGGSGRPEQVAAALGFKQYPQSICRTRLILKTS
jgi:radical SAM-linked protein